MPLFGANSMLRWIKIRKRKPLNHCSLMSGRFNSFYFSTATSTGARRRGHELQVACTGIQIEEFLILCSCCVRPLDQNVQKNSRCRPRGLLPCCTRGTIRTARLRFSRPNKRERCFQVGSKCAEGGYAQIIVPRRGAQSLGGLSVSPESGKGRTRCR